MKLRRPNHKTQIPVGSYGPALWSQHLYVPLDQIRTHVHVIGVSGSGKSRWLARLFLDLYRARLSATLIDPHGDLARLVLAHLVADGEFDDEATYERLLYLDLPEAERRGRFLPFNVLSQQTQPHSTAANVKEAFHRAWPALASGAAPMFDTLVQDGVKVLVSNELPLTVLYRLLTDKPFRDQLLAHEADLDVVAFFRDQFDRLSPHDQVDQAGAALRRAHLLTFSPVLRYSLGQSENLLDYRRILDQRRSMILNLALGDSDARRLLGCLITVSAEQGALARAELPPEQRLSSHHLIVDEFSEFVSQSEESLSRMLSLTRKYGLYLIMAHQTWSQTSSRLRGAMQNAGIELVFRLGRADAEYSALMLGRVNPLAVKHELSGDKAMERTHPTFFPMAEQWERWIQAICDLRPRTAFIKLPNGRVSRVTTLPTPDAKTDTKKLEAVEATYLDRYFRPQAVIEQEFARYRRETTATGVKRRAPAPSDEG